MMKASEHCCEECAILPTGFDAYIPCNKPATKVIATGRATEGPYRMCDACADHSIRNRGMTLVGPYGAEVPEPGFAISKDNIDQTWGR
jgi:hypothetical protein